MKSYKDKHALVGLLFLGIAAGLFGRGFERLRLSFLHTGDFNQATALLATEQNLAPQIQTPPTISLGFAGDIMLDRGVKAKVHTYFGGDYSKLFAHTEFLQEPDITFANLEGPVSDVGHDKHNRYSFRMDPSVVPALKAAGIDVVASANNHIGDWGVAALTDTLARLRAGGIQTCGIGMDKAEAETPAIFSKDGYTLGFLCFSDVGPDEMAATDTTPGILIVDDTDFDSIVANASKKVDALIVSFHWGVEYQAKHTARQAALATRAIAAGAVMVEGEHPHIVEDMSSYNGAPILYSLGNFIFDQAFSKETMHGLYVTANISGKSVTDVTPHPIVLDKNFAPSLVEAKN